LAFLMGFYFRLNLILFWQFFFKLLKMTDLNSRSDLI
jgi:hypothetical protein